jgi:hypothetical protein
MSKLDVKALAKSLHDQKIINLDASLRTMLHPDIVGISDPGSLVASYAVAWDHYVVVCGLAAGEEIQQLATRAGRISEPFK